MPKLRVGIVNFLNSKPLAWGFLKGHHADLFAPSYHPPALVARLLGQGNLDVGLIPSIEVQRIPGLTVLPDLCISATNEVRSVLLVSSVPADQIRRVSLDQNSRTSAALLRILMQERFHLDPEYLTERADVPRMLEEADAALASVEVPRPADADVIVHRVRPVLGKHRHVVHVGVDAIAQRKVDDAVLARERHGRLRSLQGQDA